MKSLKFKEIIRIIVENGFVETRQSGSHVTYERKADGATYRTQVQSNHLNDTCDPGTMASIIRQTGLPKSLFRK